MTRNPTLEIELFDAEGETTLHVVPAKRIVCPTCDGAGSVPPNHWYSGDEWRHELSEDDRDLYMSGALDRCCDDCKGERVVTVVDRDRTPANILAAIDELAEIEREAAAEAAAERRYMYGWGR